MCWFLGQVLFLYFMRLDYFEFGGIYWRDWAKQSALGSRSKNFRCISGSSAGWSLRIRMQHPVWAQTYRMLRPLFQNCKILPISHVRSPEGQEAVRTLIRLRMSSGCWQDAVVIPNEDWEANQQDAARMIVRLLIRIPKKKSLLKKQSPKAAASCFTGCYGKKSGCSILKKARHPDSGTSLLVGKPKSDDFMRMCVNRNKGEEQSTGLLICVFWSIVCFYHVHVSRKQSKLTKRIQKKTWGAPVGCTVPGHEHARKCVYMPHYIQKRSNRTN